jgi:queuine tRNA-ribosyltransferase
MAMKFEIIAKCPHTNARLGRITTPRGEYETPLFMPVGTMGAVKAMHPKDIKEQGFQVILSNAFHLYLRPGHEVIREVGGVHRFMAFDGGILTDSGGYQVFSLSDFRKITDDGVEFKSPVDGSMHYFTPEKVMEIQTALGSDFVMPLDECPPSVADEQKVSVAVTRTIDWANQSKQAFERLKQEHQSLFCIAQGGVYVNLRRRCIEELLKLDLPGFALGGFAVGEDQNLMLETISEIQDLLPDDKPHYLMGLGYPGDILKSVALGMDMFDCILPTRLGRTASAITSQGKLNLRNSQYRTDTRPLDENCNCYCCRTYTRALISHLVKIENISGSIILSFHNLAFYGHLMAEIRQNLRNGTFNDYYKDYLKKVLIPGI